MDFLRQTVCDGNFVNMKMNTKLISIPCFFSIACILVSCGGMGGAMPVYETSTFLPGECLASVELALNDGSQEQSLHIGDGYEVDSDVYFLNNTIHGVNKETSDGLYFCFFLDVKNHVIGRVDRSVCPERTGNWDIPSRELFQSFGKDANTIEEEFWKSFRKVAAVANNYDGIDLFNFATILYDGGLSLTADRPFAGYSAGENLAPLLTCHPFYVGRDNTSEPSVISSWMNTPEIIGRGLELPMDYTSLTFGKSILFTIPKGPFGIVEESVEFHLEIPVKVIMYLTWLRDRLTDPNAPVPYRNEVLKCSFRYPYNLK